MNANLIDLSHEIESGMVTYPGLPAPTISDYLSRAESRGRYSGQAEFQIARIDLIANTGTYCDTPYHRFADGFDLAHLPLERVACLPGIAVDLPAGVRACDADRFDGCDVRGKAVLIHTGWSRHWRTEAYGDRSHPFVTRRAAEHLAGAGAVLVGIDSLNIDDTGDLARPAHTILLGRGIPVVEHLTNLAAIGGRAFTFFAVPPRMKGVGTFAVRAFAVTAGITPST